MANQDPQPEIYTTRHTFDASTVEVTAGTTPDKSISLIATLGDSDNLRAIIVSFFR